MALAHSVARDSMAMVKAWANAKAISYELKANLHF